MGSILSLNDELENVRSSGMMPTLMLHCCCAPCASYVLELLTPFFIITVLYYNPNIFPREEYDKRAGEMQKLLRLAEYPSSVDIIVSDCDRDREVFSCMVSSYPDEPEGGRRCGACYELRLRETATRAKRDGYEFFSTTLSVSPHKNAVQLNKIGTGLAEEIGVKYLGADFKKKDGYKRSVELSRQYDLYRQTYCGCERSRAVRS